MIWLLFLVIGALVAAPFVIEGRRRTIGRAARTGAPVAYAKLSQGVTAYRWFGPARGPVVVAIHGLTTPHIAFEGIAAGLGTLGYRVLAYDLYGRGLSDAPEGAQTPDFFARQLQDLLADQGLDDDLTLMGYSMGGAIATHFAARNPDRMKRLVLLAPAGVELAEDGFTRLCRTTPLVGDWLFHVLGARAMAREIRAGATTPDVTAAQLNELERKGFVAAVLSSRRSTLADTQEDAHRLLGREGIDTIALWGDADTVIPISAVGRLTQWNRNVRQEVLAGATHAFPYAQPDDVVDRLKDVLREKI